MRRLTHPWPPRRRLLSLPLRPLLLLLLTVLVLGGPQGSALAEEQAGVEGALVLEDGTRVPCRIVSTEGPRVRVAIGGRSYTFLRGDLQGLERADGSRWLDETVLELVRALVPHLDADSAERQAAARAGLLALRPRHDPELRQVLGGLAEGARQTALAAILAATPPARPGRQGAQPAAAPQGLAPVLDQASTALGLTQAERKEIETAFALAVQALEAGQDRSQVEAAFYGRLDASLGKARSQEVRAWFAARRKAQAEAQSDPAK